MKTDANAPVFSIIMPTFNHAKFIGRAIESALAQTFDTWELIIVNNFSTDETESVVQSYSDPRIKLVSFSNNGIIAASRNYGISLSSAPIIALLDSDDVWYPTKLQKCYERIQEGFDIVCHAEIWVGPESRRRTVIYGPEKQATFEKILFNGNCLSTSATVFKRHISNAIGNFDVSINFNTAEDYDLWLKLLHNGARVGFIREVLGEYLIHETNQSRGNVRNMEAELEVFNFHVNNLPPGTKVFPWSVRRRTALIYYSGARMLQEASLFAGAWKYFLKAVVIFPFVAKFYLAMLLNIFHLKPR